MKFNFIKLIALVLTCVAYATATLADWETIPTKGNWLEVKPGGETICARGDDYSFFVYPGSSDKVIIDFIGGGACWSEETCAKNTAIFVDNVDYLRKRYEEGLEGIYKKSENNPLKDWTHVVIPYCTGDIHWGNNVVTYGKGKDAFKIHHKGALNAKTVLAWATKKYAKAKDVFVTGCSAGSYGSIYWTPFIKHHMQGSRVFQLGDSGVGVITKDFFSNSFQLWKAQENAPRWIPDLNPDVNDWHKLNLHDFYTKIGKFYPNTQLSQYTTAFDSNQAFYYEMMGGGDETEWSNQMYDNLRTAHKDLSNFSYFIAPGTDHCILPYEKFYKAKSDQTTFLNWIKKLKDGEKLESVECVDCDPL